jgi:hypothetical protein
MTMRSTVEHPDILPYRIILDPLVGGNADINVGNTILSGDLALSGDIRSEGNIDIDSNLSDRSSTQTGHLVTDGNSNITRRWCD